MYFFYDVGFPLGSPLNFSISAPMSGAPKNPFPYGSLYDSFIHCDREHPFPGDVMFRDGRHEMTDEEARIYSKQVRESEGFDIGPLDGIIAIGIICPLHIDEDPETLYQCIDLAIEEYCKNHDGKKLKLKEAIKWNARPLYPSVFYITFTAEDEETGEVETYQAKVREKIPKEKTYVEMVRVKPKERLPGGSEREENKEIDGVSGIMQHEQQQINAHP